ncbi:stage V sporulation protein AD [Blautia wexlerae]|nr:stage V sporulation protein AD [Blautia wexlerae]
MEQIPGKLAESTLQKQAALLAIKKNGLTCSDIQLLFAGDLLAQTSASSFGTADLKIPFYGLFGACSTMGESLSLGSMCIDGGYGKYILCATSSHFASAEKEFRFPLGYGNQRPLSATWTVTGAGACILGYEPPPRPDNKTLNTLRNRNICAVITGITTGRLIDFWVQGFPQYGSLHGSCCLRHHSPKSSGFSPKTIRL